MRNLTIPAVLIICLCAFVAPSHAITFDAAVQYSVGDGPINIVTADFDNDGDMDIVTANSNSDDLSIVNNNGSGIFPTTYPWDLRPNVDPSPLCHGDFDQDGDIDMVALTMRATSLTNDPSAWEFHFIWAAEYYVGWFPNGICTADLDGDNYPDLAVSLWDMTGVDFTGVVVMLNCGGSFLFPVEHAVGSHPTAVCAADLDGDGDNDLAVTDNAYVLSVLVNNGDATFESPVDYAVDSRPVSLCHGDLDGDGDIDLVTANDLGLGVSVLMNNGNATFAEAVDYSVGTAASSVCVADFDNDGALDLAVTPYFASSVLYILQNDGSGVFSLTGAFEVGLGPYAVCAADFDGDDDIDLAASLYGADSIAILMNTTIVTEASDGPDADALPNSIQLHQNHPNPFNPSTTIEFDLPHRSQVDVTIYNINGQAVRHLLSEELAAGTHTIEWNGCCDAGKAAATGIYLCRFKAGEYEATTKMALLK